MTTTSESATHEMLDGFEIKLNFNADQIENALHVFGFDADEGKSRQIWFGEVVAGLDGPGALPLSARGLILRARRKKSKGGDVTIKLRGPDGGLDVQAWRDGAGGGPDAKVEGDWAARHLISASLGHDLDETAAQELGDARPALTPLLSPQQQSLARQMLIPLGHVRPLGPITARKWDAVDDVEAELWEVDHLRFLELSVLVKEDPDGAMEGLQERAVDGGLDLSANQETKTTTVLRHLATRP